MDEATGEIKLIRQYFRRGGIKILDETRDTANQPGGGFSYGSKYVCRGYAGSFSMLDGALAAEIEIMKRKFLGEDVTRFIKEESPPK